MELFNRRFLFDYGPSQSTRMRKKSRKIAVFIISYSKLNFHLAKLRNQKWFRKLGVKNECDLWLFFYNNPDLRLNIER